MNTTCKRLLCLVLVLILTVSFSAPAFAAAKPYATLAGPSSRTVRAGYTYSVKFCLHSGSYTRYRGYYQARFDTDMYRDSTAKRIAYTNYVYFTGNPMLTVKYSFYKSAYPKGWYNLRYRTWYRTSYNSSVWQTASVKWMYFKVV